MARSYFSLPKHHSSRKRFLQWSKSAGYEEVYFDEKTWEGAFVDYTTTIYHHLEEADGYQTFAKLSHGNSLLVFEVKWDEDFHCSCYSPIMLFGFWRIELKFKPTAGIFTKYLGIGHSDMDALIQVLSKELVDD